jgi:hypothetical protein
MRRVGVVWHLDLVAADEVVTSCKAYNLLSVSKFANGSSSLSPTNSCLKAFSENLLTNTKNT